MKIKQKTVASTMYESILPSSSLLVSHQLYSIKIRESVNVVCINNNDNWYNDEYEDAIASLKNLCSEGTVEGTSKWL